MVNKQVKLLLNICPMKQECYHCTYFNENSKETYRCACIGYCTGITFSKEFKDFITNDILYK